MFSYSLWTATLQVGPIRNIYTVQHGACGFHACFRPQHRLVSEHPDHHNMNRAGHGHAYLCVKTDDIYPTARPVFVFTGPDKATISSCHSAKRLKSSCLVVPKVRFPEFYHWCVLLPASLQWRKNELMMLYMEFQHQKYAFVRSPYECSNGTCMYIRTSTIDFPHGCTCTNSTMLTWW